MKMLWAYSDEWLLDKHSFFTNGYKKANKKMYFLKTLYLILFNKLFFFLHNNISRPKSVISLNVNDIHSINTDIYLLIYAKMCVNFIIRKGDCHQILFVIRITS